MYKKFTYYEDTNSFVTMENYEEKVFVHVNIIKGSKKTLLRLLEVWAEIKAWMYWSGYEEVFSYTTDKRMFKFFPGAEILGSFKLNGEQYEVGRWELK